MSCSIVLSCYTSKSHIPALKFEALPDDVLQKILSHLPQKSIIALSKTSKLLKSSSYSRLYGKIYIILSTYCRTHEFTTNNSIITSLPRNDITIISGLLPFTKFAVRTLPNVKCYVKRLYIDYLSFDPILDPAIFKIFQNQTTPALCSKPLTYSKPGFNIESVNGVARLFLKHVCTRFKDMDGEEFDYFDWDNKKEGDIIIYNTTLNYAALTLDMNEVIEECSPFLNVIDFRAIEAFDLLNFKSQKNLTITRLTLKSKRERQA